MAVTPVTYAFYTGTYGGSAISSEEWTGYEARARAKLERIEALYKVTELSEDGESMAVCAMAEEYRNFDVAANSGGSAGIAKSLSVGSVSVAYDTTFGGSVDLTPAGQEAALMRAAEAFLHVYRGVG